MILRWLLALFACCLFFRSGFAQQDSLPSNSADLQPTILQLINDLGHSSVDKRDTAQRSLKAIGPTALATVRSIYEDGKLVGETETRLAQVLQELQREQLKEYMKESLVTLSGSFTLSNAVEKVGEVSGNQVKVEEGSFDGSIPDPKVIVNFKDEPFWQVIDTLCDEHNLVVIPYSEQGTLLLRPGSQFGLPRRQRAQYNGPFRLEVVSVASTRSFENPALDGLRATIQISWEPRLRPLLFNLDKDSLLGECDDGAVLESLDDLQQEISPSMATMANSK